MLKNNYFVVDYHCTQVFLPVTSQAASFIRQGVNKVLSALAAVIKRDQMLHFLIVSQSMLESGQRQRIWVNTVSHAN